MNIEVENSIAETIQAWKMGQRDFTFESRGFGGFIQPKFMNGEALMRFHIAIDGFFEDEQHHKPITLDYSSRMFQTTIRTVVQPNNANADAERLKAFLEKFTAEVYENVLKVLSSYNTLYSSDPIHM